MSNRYPTREQVSRSVRGFGGRLAPESETVYGEVPLPVWTRVEFPGLGGETGEAIRDAACEAVPGGLAETLQFRPVILVQTLEPA